MCGFVFSNEVVEIVQAFESNHFGAVLLVFCLVAVLATNAWHRGGALLPRRRVLARKKRKTRRR
jgi:uncharacterized membrane protein